MVPVILLALVPLAPADPVRATVETTLPTATGQIRQFAFDGDGDSFFASARNAGKADHFTLVFDKPVTVTSVGVVTGRPNGGDSLKAGAIEVSADGTKFFPATTIFTDGHAGIVFGGRGPLPFDGGRVLRAVRIRPTDDLDHPLVVREFAIKSDPPITAFKYPVEVVVDVTDAPDMKDWAEKAARVCERQYPMLCEELMSPGFKPRTVITMTLKSNYNGVAATGGGRITGSVKYFKSHPDDIGAMVHETAHAVQSYRTRNNPGWLVEGVADYVRFFKYEANRPKPLPPERAKYDGSYRITAAFLAYLVEKYDKDIVLKLNRAMREGEYTEDIWKGLTKKTLPELGEEWKASLKR